MIAFASIGRRADRTGACGRIEGGDSAANDFAGTVLAEVAQGAAAAGFGRETVHIENRNPSGSILQAARESGCDLAVTAAHGWRGLDRLLASRASTVLTCAHDPVLVVPQGVTGARRPAGKWMARAALPMAAGADAAVRDRSRA